MVPRQVPARNDCGPDGAVGGDPPSLQAARGGGNVRPTVGCARCLDLQGRVTSSVAERSSTRDSVKSISSGVVSTDHRDLGNAPMSRDSRDMDDKMDGQANGFADAAVCRAHKFAVSTQ